MGALVTFEPIKNIAPSRLLGIRVALVGFLIALLGALIRVANVELFNSTPALQSVSYIVACVGIGLGLIGAGIHFYILLFKKT